MATPKVNISHVAEAAGVSRSTVSYVLSSKRSISPEVRERVMKAIEKLGYKPNAVARSLASKATHTIGFYCSNDASKNDLFFLKLLHGAMEALKERGYKVLLINEIEETKDYRILVDRTFPIDGAIVTNARNSEVFLTELQKEKLPFVLIGKPPKGVHVHHVDNDNVQASYSATEAFLRDGKTNIALVVGPSEEATVYNDYITGYVMALGDYRVSFQENGVIRLGNNRMDSVDKALEKLQALNADAILINAPTSLSASLVNRINAGGLKTKDLRMTVFGLDVFEGLFELPDSGLRFIQSNARLLGAEAAFMVADLILGKGNVMPKIFNAAIK